MVTLRIDRPIEEQLQRRRLHIRHSSHAMAVTDRHPMKQIIAKNASLRINFGWSFECLNQFERMMEECIEQIVPKYNSAAGNMVSDGQCSWLGFTPFNVFERVVYEDLSTYGLIIFNNDLIDFQIAVISFIAQHKSFKEHSLLRNESYRFDYYKAIRQDPIALEDAFHYFIDSIKETSGLEVIPQGYLEECIGCHYLHHPDVFFELLDFYTLKGSIYGK
jgi:hypothetical protein